MKILIYTALTQNYDNLPPIKKESNVDYICFTDNPNIKSNDWKIIGMDNRELLDYQRLSRKYKILGISEIEDKYDYVMYIDCSVDFSKGVKKYVSDNIDDTNEIYFLKHPVRNCTYEEAEECIKLKKDKVEIINKQMKFFEKEKFPKNYGLIAGTVILRKTKSKEYKKLSKEWFNWIKNNSRRDQLSIMYCIWKLKIKKYKVLDIDLYNNQYFTLIDHNPSFEKIIEDLKKENFLLKKENKQLKSWENKLEEDISWLTNQNKKLVEENEKVVSDYNRIVNSKGWIILEKIRKIIRK